MKTVISAKIKLNTTPEQFAGLRATQLAYRDALNFVSRYAFEHGKMSNKVTLQEGTYDDIRARFHLPSQMACSVSRQVGTIYKGLWTKVQKNAEDRKSGRTKKRYRGLDQAPSYISPTQYKKDYSFKKDNHVSVLTLEGRVIVGGDKRTRERLKADANHVVSKRTVIRHPNSLIGLEYLTDIRERTHRKKGKKATRKQRRANAAYSKWSFAELQSMIAYKAPMHGSMAIKVDANYTSQACLMCGHTAPENRPEKGLLFCCQKCHYTLHADLLGSRNITIRTLLIRQDWMSTGTLSECPDASDKEAKAKQHAFPGMLSCGGV